MAAQLKLQKRPDASVVGTLRCMDVPLNSCVRDNGLAVPHVHRYVCSKRANTKVLKGRFIGGMFRSKAVLEIHELEVLRVHRYVY